MADISQTRRACKGSCHCGAIRYIVFLRLPHVRPTSRGQQTLYRCNCTTCQKLCMLHIRLESAPDDFLLLSPLNPLEELLDYRTGSKRIHWLSCRTCGGRCIIFAGDGEEVEADLGELGVEGEEKGKMVKAWKPKAEGWEESARKGSYLSVNGYTLDADQKGLDPREWVDNKTMMYLDFLHQEKGRDEYEFGGPCAGGSY